VCTACDTARRSTGRALIRFLGAVLATSGALLVGDAAVTLTWQEPVSALFAARSQGALESELAAESHAFARETSSPSAANGGASLDEGIVAAAYAKRLHTGDAVGRIAMPTLGRSYVVVEGTDTETLRKGPAHYPDTALPGQGGTVAVAGHRTTYLAPFRSIDELQSGQPIVVTMPYGRFTYRVESRRIVDPTALWVTKRVAHERLVLTACHPLYSAAQRIVVFARLSRSEPALTRLSRGKGRRVDQIA